MYMCDILSLLVGFECKTGVETYHLQGMLDGGLVMLLKLRRCEVKALCACVVRVCLEFVVSVVERKTLLVEYVVHCCGG